MVNGFAERQNVKYLARSTVLGKNSDKIKSWSSFSRNCYEKNVNIHPYHMQTVYLYVHFFTLCQIVVLYVYAVSHGESYVDRELIDLVMIE